MRESSKLYQKSDKCAVGFKSFHKYVECHGFDRDIKLSSKLEITTRKKVTW